MNHELTEEQIEILKHAAYRCLGGAFCGDSPDMRVLVKKGLMVSGGKKSSVPGEYFRLTVWGRKILREYL